jgi:hypothetical protein
MDASGRLTVVWGEARPNATCVRLARYGPAGEAVTSEPPTSCEGSAAGTAEAPQVAIAASAAGDVGVVWSRRLTGGQHELLLRRLSPVGTWGPIVTVEPAAGGKPARQRRRWRRADRGRLARPERPGRAFMRRFDLDLRPFAAKKLIASTFPPHEPSPSCRQPRRADRRGMARRHQPCLGVDIRGQIFLPDGTPRPYGRLVPILPDELLNEGLPFRPAIASDRVGGWPWSSSGNRDTTLATSTDGNPRRDLQPPGRRGGRRVFPQHAIPGLTTQSCGDPRRRRTVSGRLGNAGEQRRSSRAAGPRGSLPHAAHGRSVHLSRRDVHLRVSRQ